MGFPSLAGSPIVTFLNSGCVIRRVESEMKNKGPQGGTWQVKRTAEPFARQDLQLGGLEAIENSFEGAD